MEATGKYIAYWKTLNYLDILGTIFIITLVVIIISSNMVFNKFIKSKPSGRKTVLGIKNKHIFDPQFPCWISAYILSHLFLGKPSLLLSYFGQIEWLWGSWPSVLNIIKILFSAHVNLAAYHTASCCLIILYIGFLLRIILGPFSYAGVVAYHYGFRTTMVSILNMLTFKTGLNILFIWDFNRVANISEKRVMTWMFLTTSISTLAHLFEEAITRDNRGLKHFSRQCFNTYLGKVYK